MTTTTAGQPATPTGARFDTRTVRRLTAAVLLPVGPLSVAILRGILPYSTADDIPAQIADTAAGLGREDAVLWLSLLGIVALIPSMLAGARLAQRGAPVLSMISVGLLVPAFTALFFFAGDPTLRAVAGGAVDPAAGAAVLEAQFSLGPVAAAGVIFIAGHIVGLIVLGAALWRAHAVPAWAAVAVIASQPLHFVFAVVAPNQALDAAAWGLAALGLGAAALRVLRTPNGDWDVA
jgi:hypothetical protein